MEDCKKWASLSTSVLNNGSSEADVNLKVGRLT